MINWLLDAGLGVSNLSLWGKTPLITSAEKGCIDSAVLLLQRGAMSNLNHADREGNTALHYVAQKGSQDFAMLLLTCGTLLASVIFTHASL
jgi:ankyrin repeat protein